MRIFKFLVVLCVLLLYGGAAQAGRPGTLPNRLTFVTFSGAVTLPGVALAAGTYRFELADASAGSNVVAVFNREHSWLYYLGLTLPVERPSGLPVDRVVTFGESTRGMPPPISAWYPIGESRGYQFVYKAQ